MKLIPLQSGDLGLYVKLFTDPIYMADLGGPQPLEKVPKILQKQIDSHNSGAGIVLKIVPEEGDWLAAKEKRENKGFVTAEEPFYDFENDFEWKEGIGSVCLWFYEDTPEIGYGVLPKYQNFGFTSKAVSMLLDIARQDKERWKIIYVMTAISNVPSNQLLQRLNFKFLEACEMDYDDRKIPANRYCYDLNN